MRRRRRWLLPSAALVALATIVWVCGMNPETPAPHRAWSPAEVAGGAGTDRMDPAEPKEDPGAAGASDRAPDAGTERSSEVPLRVEVLTQTMLAEIQRVDQVLAQMRARQREEDARSLRAVEAHLAERPEDFEDVLPDGATPSRAIVRGVTWLARQQLRNGHWDGGPVCDTLATTVLVVADVRTRWAHVAALRLRVFRDPPHAAEPEEALPREPADQARVLFARCLIVSEHTRGNLTRNLAALVDRLREYRNPGGCWGFACRDEHCDPGATAWAIAALGSLVELSDEEAIHGESAAIEQAKATLSRLPRTPDAPAMHVIASLLHRQYLTNGREDDDTKRWSRQLVESLTRRQDRPLDEWLLGTRALRPYDYAAWRAWRSAMLEEVLLSQQEDGSWLEQGRKNQAGRIRATALAILCLREADQL